MNIEKELSWILGQLGLQKDIYMLAGIIEKCDYCVDDIHSWAATNADNLEVQRLYGKIRDLMHIRILDAISGGTLEKTTGEGMLKVFYYKKYEEEQSQAAQKKYVRMPTIKFNGEAMEFEIG